MIREEILSSFFLLFWFARFWNVSHLQMVLIFDVNQRSYLASAVGARQLSFEGAYISEEDDDLFLAELFAEGRHLATTVDHRINEPLVINSFLPL